MKKLQASFAVLALAAFAGLAAPARAEETAAPAAAQMSFGFVDTEKVFQASDAAKAMMQELEGKRKEYQAQITKEENALRAAGQEFEKQRGKLDKEKLEAKRKDIDKRLVNGQKMVQERKIQLDRAYAGAMAKLRGEIMKIVGELAKEKSLSVVFTQESVMLSLPQMDMTQDVIKRLNDQVKKVAIDWDAAKAAKQ